MTAKQKQNIERFKRVVAEAKKLRKKNPKLTQPQAVKQAWAILYKSKKVGATKVIEKGEKKGAKVTKVLQRVRSKKGTFKGYKRVAGSSHKDTKSHNVNIRVVSGLQKMLSGFFDTAVIKDIDQLKKQYFQLAKKYHPDAGGTTSQFQNLQSEYQKLLLQLLNGSTLNKEQKDNEIIIDKAIRDVIDSLINVENINIELIGKWLWISGNTYPVRQTLKNAGLVFIKKEGKPYWVYKGVESSSRGKTGMEEIKQKYGVYEIKAPSTKRIGVIPKVNKLKLKTALNKLTKALNKRPV